MHIKAHEMMAQYVKLPVAKQDNSGPTQSSENHTDSHKLNFAFHSRSF